ncbi:MAG: D-alanyl-D-alanine carboxypeptidase [Solirubrobacterales bacterium]|nr:D-alanyl-D-alanine carboxypeptidase [Solirubrobacterales bacterium]
MSTSPFMTPGQSRLRRERAAERRRRRRQIGSALLAVAAIGIAIALLAGASSKGHRRSVAHAGTAKPLAPKAPPLSPAGLVLAPPALKLAGIGTPSKDPIQLRFRHPPRAGLLFNLQTGQVLWQRNANRRVAIASLTKMMTALLTVKGGAPNEHVLVTRAAVDSNGSKVGVLPFGKHVRLETMLYGLMLPSGNDAAVALAQHLAGSIKAFVADMNSEAARLGMGCTRYSSPSGYFDQENFSCAADLAMLARVDLDQPRIARVVDTYSAALPFPIKGGKLYLYNNNPLLIYHYPGTTGLKTGFTIAAGRCLVATAERGGVKLGVVVLNSSAPGTQSRQLLDRGFQNVYHLPRVTEQPMPPGA